MKLISDYTKGTRVSVEGTTVPVLVGLLYASADQQEKTNLNG